MGTRTVTTHVSDVDGTDIPPDKVYLVTIRKPDGSTQVLDISERNYKGLKIEGFGKTQKKRGRKPRAAAASAPASAPRTRRRRASASTARTGPARRSAASSSSRGYDPKAVRAWAQSQGIAVSARGRVPSSLIEQYRASQSKSK